ncbi:hypothetical protein HDA40_000710 [Hamadaea flava]|uniref:Uncharacterized protein n=1 Tax=Hamadaea flava TaxID=1742688 RepID=A0ABV8LYG3_9ACTN|nr:hypothetical protein [Hamadaea flava]MCP2322203.1 hypothetical protein [Hamadaea flava]
MRLGLGEDGRAVALLDHVKQRKHVDLAVGMGQGAGVNHANQNWLNRS